MWTPFERKAMNSRYASGANWGTFFLNSNFPNQFHDYHIKYYIVFFLCVWQQKVDYSCWKWIFALECIMPKTIWLDFNGIQTLRAKKRCEVRNKAREKEWEKNRVKAVKSSTHLHTKHVRLLFQFDGRLYDIDFSPAPWSLILSSEISLWLGSPSEIYYLLLERKIH